MRLQTLLAALLLAACAPALALDTSSATYRGVSYTVVTVRPGSDDLRLSWRGLDGQPYGTVAALKSALSAQGRTLLFATNSGIYAPGLKPLGLHVQRGETLVGLNRAKSGGNFALLPNGVFWVRGSHAGVSESRAYDKLKLSPDSASQSGPLLVQSGRLHPSFNAGSQSLKLRSGVGVCRGGPGQGSKGQGSVVKFVISGSGVNFYDFARFFRDALGCPDALYLDGSISTFYTPGNPGFQLAPYAGIWSVSVPAR
ncbi:phosphodiester glycosidase family protein [Deinococcus radiomollis]|uniref:phosphodiester glycosidase family protein n=1 Tax=Deinococcus radiomollis TaxID=468916 RepID=UPI003891CD5F